MDASLCDEMVPDSTVSISSESWDSQASEDHEGIADEILLSSSSSTASDTTESVVATVNSSVNSNLPFASYGNTVDGIKGPSDITQTPVFLTVRPINARLPTTISSNKARSFNLLWYKTYVYDWLEYSVEMDACFCYPCRMFGA